MANLSLYSLFVAIIFAYTVSVSFGLYLGTGGVVGSSNPRHRITPRTGYRASSYSPRRSSGRIINYGVVSGSGGYRPAQYSPGPGIVGWALPDCMILSVTDFSWKAIVKYLPLWGEALNEKNQNQ